MLKSKLAQGCLALAVATALFAAAGCGGGGETVADSGQAGAGEGGEGQGAGAPGGESAAAPGGEGGESAAAPGGEGGEAGGGSAGAGGEAGGAGTGGGKAGLQSGRTGQRQGGTKSRSGGGSGGGGGGGGATTPASPADAAFFEAADAICRARRKNTRQNLSDYTKAGLENLEQNAEAVIAELVIPNLEAEMREIRALNPPPSAGDAVAALFGAIEGMIAAAEAEPRNFIFKTDTVAESEETAQSNGFKICGGI